MESFLEVKHPWDSVLKYGTRHFVPENTTLYKQGSYGDGFYYLYKGFAKILTSTSKGKERQISLVLPGQTLGIQAIDRKVHVTTAVTVKNCILYYFPTDLMKDNIQSDSECLFLVTSAIIRNTTVLTNQITLDTMTAGQQIASVLLSSHEALKQNGIRLSQKDLVNLTGLTRITVYKVLKEWTQRGIITTLHREIIVLQPHTLKSEFSTL